MPEADAVRLSRSFRIPATELFRLWTDPAELTHWFGPGEGWTAPLVVAEAWPGGAFRFLLQSPERKTRAAVGVYREVRAPERLAFTWAREEAPCGAKERPDTTESTVTIDLRPADGGTSLTLVHSGLPDDRTREEYRRFWEGCLDRLRRRSGPIGGH